MVKGQNYEVYDRMQKAPRFLKLIRFKKLTFDTLDPRSIEKLQEIIISSCDAEECVLAL